MTNRAGSTHVKRSLRVWPPRYARDPAFEDLCAFLSAHRPAVDEISLFTEYLHDGHLADDEVVANAGLLRLRIGALRELGYGSVGINVLATIGHKREGHVWWRRTEQRAMVGHDGRAARGSLCPRSEGVRAATAWKYATYASAGPDFIWVDDDIRLHNLDVAYGCFCSDCLSAFSEAVGRTWTRSDLVNALNGKAGSEERIAWQAFARDSLTQLLALIRATINEADSRIGIGLMTTSLISASYLDEVVPGNLSALGADRVRPGGGFWNDEKPLDLIRKSHEVTRQISVVPVAVRDRQYELENFRYHLGAKSIQLTMTECTMAIMSGCNGISMNALRQDAGSLRDYHPLFDAFELQPELWDSLLSRAAGLPLEGLHPAFSPAFAATRPVDGNWFHPVPAATTVQAYELSKVGIPLTTDPGEGCAVVLSGAAAEGYSRQDLERMLTGAVLLDAEVLQTLEKKGLAPLTGVSPGEGYVSGVIERFATHDWNGQHAGEQRDARLVFGGRAASTLVPLSPEVEVLAELVDPRGQQLGPCFTWFVNQHGGRVAVHSYAPWEHITSRACMQLLTVVADRLMPRGVVVKVDRPMLMPMVRASADRTEVLVVLVNMSIDPAQDVVLLVNADASRWEQLTPRGPHSIPCEAWVQPGWKFLAVGAIAPWGTAVLATAG